MNLNFLCTYIVYVKTISESNFLGLGYGGLSISFYCIYETNSCAPPMFPRADCQTYSPTLTRQWPEIGSTQCWPLDYFFAVNIHSSSRSYRVFPRFSHLLPWSEVPDTVNGQGDLRVVNATHQLHIPFLTALLARPQKGTQC